MVIIAGTVIEKDNKILMVQEAKKKCYGQWNTPAGHVDEFEKITDAAIREAYEETGCIVNLTGVLPIRCLYGEEGQIIMIRFTANIVKENITIDEDEILDVKWIDIDKLKAMPDEELRGAKLIKSYISDFENNNVYPLELFDDEIYYNK